MNLLSHKVRIALTEHVSARLLGMNGTPGGRPLGRTILGFVVPAAIAAFGMLYLVGVIDVPSRGWIGALFLVAATISAVGRAQRLRRQRSQR